MSTTTTPTTPLTDAELAYIEGSSWAVGRFAVAEIRALRRALEDYRLWLTKATVQLDALRAERDDLLAALKVTEAALSRWLDCDDCDHSVGICFCEDKRTRDAARAAIARAEGRAA